jgi:uncharacterized BrkB/YihY/UPF0761 family membrane protein
MQASKNSGAATSAYFMLSAFPTALVAVALFHRSGGDANALAERLITHMHFVTCGLLGLLFVTTTQTASSSRALFIPIWFAGAIVYWLWTPRFLLHRKVTIRRLLPGAIVGAFVLGGTIGKAPLWMGPTLNQNAKAFGSFGVVVAIVAFVLIAITISIVCAVFAPVWEEFRRPRSGARRPRRRRRQPRREPRCRPDRRRGSTRQPLQSRGATGSTWRLR